MLVRLALGVGLASAGCGPRGSDVLGSFSAVHAGLGGPCVSHRGYSLEQFRGLAENIDQDCTIQVRASRVGCCFTCRPEEPVAEVVKNAPCSIQRVSTGEHRIHKDEVTQCAHGQHGSSRLLTASRPPEREQSQGGVRPENDESVVRFLVQADVRPRSTAQTCARCEASCQALGVEPEVEIEMQPGSGLPDLSGHILVSLANFARGVWMNHQISFAGGVMTPQDRIPGSSGITGHDSEWASGRKTRASFAAPDEPVNFSGHARVTKGSDWKGPDLVRCTSESEVSVLQGHRGECQRRVPDAGAPTVGKTGLYSDPFRDGCGSSS